MPSVGLMGPAPTVRVATVPSAFSWSNVRPLMSLSETKTVKLASRSAQQSVRFHSCARARRALRPRSTCHQSCVAAPAVCVTELLP